MISHREQCPHPCSNRATVSHSHMCKAAIRGGPYDLPYWNKANTNVCRVQKAAYTTYPNFLSASCGSKFGPELRTTSSEMWLLWLWVMGWFVAPTALATYCLCPAPLHGCTQQVSDQPRFQNNERHLQAAAHAILSGMLCTPVLRRRLALILIPGTFSERKLLFSEEPSGFLPCLSSGLFLFAPFPSPCQHFVQSFKKHSGASC